MNIREIEIRVTVTKENLPTLGERKVTRATVMCDGEEMVCGVAYHWPGDPWDFTVGAALATSRALTKFSKGLKEMAYDVMMKNIEKHRVMARILKRQRQMRRKKGNGAATHQSRLAKALAENKVLYCECGKFFGNTGDMHPVCPHCEGTAYRTKYYQNNKKLLNGEDVAIQEEDLEGLTWDCPNCGRVELSINRTCRACGAIYDEPNKGT